MCTCQTAIIIFKDLDECDTSNGGCEEICMNTDGSFYCDCPGDLVLQGPEYTSCNGRNSYCSCNICSTCHLMFHCYSMFGWRSTISEWNK